MCSYLCSFIFFSFFFSFWGFLVWFCCFGTEALYWVFFFFLFIKTVLLLLCKFYVWGPTVSGTQTTLEETRPNIWSHMYELSEKGPGPTSNLRVREYSRTINKRRDRVRLRGEVKNARGDLTVSEDYSHLGTSIRGVWWTYQSFRITPRTNPTAKWKGKISNRR